MNLPKLPKTHLITLISITSFAVAGTAFVTISRAATPFVSADPENGTLTSPASRVTDSTASGGSAIKFGTSAPSNLTAQDLTYVKTKRILFGHQSVGLNMIDAIPGLYASYGVSSPNIIGYLPQINTSTGGFFAGFDVGVNGDPVGKTTDFNSKVRQYGSKLDIALMKFCFIDIGASTNALTVFNAYKSTMDGLARDYPNIKLVYTTGALENYSVEDSLVKEQLNAMIRQQYGSTGRLFDLAKVESTRPDGTRVSATSGGSTYYQLYSGYTTDGGHLNSTGAQVVDTALFKLLASL